MATNQQGKGASGAPAERAPDLTLAYDPAAIRRPDPALMRYYVVVALLTVAGFPFVIWPLVIRYCTLRYHFDDSGVSMSWGWLFQKQIYLTYRRIQDIHVTRNILHRWLGLASVELQTAAGSSSAEMTIEGILNPEPLRDYLYARMRGASDLGSREASAGAASEADGLAADDALVLLREIRDDLRALREKLG